MTIHARTRTLPLDAESVCLGLSACVGRPCMGYARCEKGGNARLETGRGGQQRGPTVWARVERRRRVSGLGAGRPKRGGAGKGQERAPRYTHYYYYSTSVLSLSSGRGVSRKRRRTSLGGEGAREGGREDVPVSWVTGRLRSRGGGGIVCCLCSDRRDRHIL